MSNFRKDLSKATSAFELFKSIICSHIKGDLISIELENTKLSKMFDQYSGVDAFQLVNNKLRSVALRMQKCQGKKWNTFTIRYTRSSGAKTEYKKRLEAILSGRGFLYPYLTIQAYYDETKKELLSFGVVKTEDLYNYVSMNLPKITKRTNKQDGNVMLVISFSELQKRGVNVLIYDNEKNIAA